MELNKETGKPMDVDSEPSNNPSIVNNNHVHQKNKSKSSCKFYVLYFS